MATHYLRSSSFILYLLTLLTTTNAFDTSTSNSHIQVVLPSSSSSSSTSSSPTHPVPFFGYGGEYIFQTVTDAGLNAALVETSSTITRFPGGTPADYWNWDAGWLQTPTGPGCGGCDALPVRPTNASSLQSYLSTTSQQAVFVVNQLTSNVSYQIQGLQAHEAAGTPITHIELGNEMYDATRADVMKEYPLPIDYATKMSNWTLAMKSIFPTTKIAWVGVANTWDNRTDVWNQQVMPVAVAANADAATVHLYPGLPGNVNVTDPSTYPQVLSTQFPLLTQYQQYTDMTIPSQLKLWVTEWGTWGLPSIENTWLQALWHTSLLLQLPIFLPRIEVLLPYCSVCGDPNMPSFTATGYGPIAPPNVTVNASAWQRTPSGHGYALAFSVVAAQNVSSIQALTFSPNPVLDPSVPSSVTFVGLQAMDKEGENIASIYMNLGSSGVSLNVTSASILVSCENTSQQQVCGNVFSPSTIADVVQQNIQINQLNHTVTNMRMNNMMLTLPGYSIGTVMCGVC